ncbi:MAG: Phosphoserine phosphatase RsbU [Chlamydiae bacterium]|nr:Phosphoserine phosphatase RsbU [Chlamydiota bacterium]
MEIAEKQEFKESHDHPEWLQSVLIVDDEPMTVEALQLTLEGVGLEVYKAECGEEALKIIERTPLAVIICDLNLPDITGLEVLKQAMVLQPNTSRIVITGTANLNIAADLINITHVSHFILKPWDYNVLVQAVESSVEKFNLLRENRRLNELTSSQTNELKKNHENLQHELAIGGRVQNLLLEGKVPHDIPGTEITGLTVPSKVVDGDFYDFYHSAPHILDFVIGDVMGKGLPAALVGTAMKFQLARFAAPSIHPLAHQKNKGWHLDLMEPHDILKEVNNEIYTSLVKLEHFVSLLYGRFNFKNQTFTYVDCGSTKPLHYQKDKQRITTIAGDNFPLGIGTENEIYRQKKIKFEKDDLIVFYSDGVSEAQSPNGELFGTKRLEALIEQHHHRDPNELMELIKRQVSHFAQKETFDDDLTLLIFKIKDSSHLENAISRDIARFNSHLSQLKAIRKFVEAFCIKVMDQLTSVSNLLELVVDEVFCNIVQHGYKGESGNEVIIQADYLDDCIILEILDQGKPFDPSEIEHPNLVGKKDEGFGFYLVKDVADKISYQRKKSANGWNCLRITKKIGYQGMDMELSHYNKNDIIVITLEGENLDARESPDFKQRVNDLISKEGSHNVILDLGLLNFIDSTGLGSFLSIMRSLNTAHGNMKLANMSNPIRTIFELVCMHKIFDIYDSVDDAIAAFHNEKAGKKD